MTGAGGTITLSSTRQWKLKALAWQKFLGVGAINKLWYP